MQNNQDEGAGGQADDGRGMNAEAVKIFSNILINYVSPGCRRLGIDDPADYMRPETLALFARALDEKRYSMHEFRAFMRQKEEDYAKDLKAFGHPYMIESFEIIKLFPEAGTILKGSLEAK